MGREANVKDVVKKGRFNVHLPHVFGFCNGVVAALRKIERTLTDVTESEGGRRIFLLGEIIHNATVNERLVARGVTIIPHQEIHRTLDMVGPHDIIVIPAFGIPAPLDEEIHRRHQGQIIDTTCGNVKKVWSFVASEAAVGATVLLHARPDHPETKATISRAATGRNAAVVIPDEAAARVFADLLRETGRPADTSLHWSAPDRFSRQRIALANQTTMPHDETLRIAKLIKEAARQVGTEFTVCDTICEATKKRQDAACELCKKKLDVILVVGGYDSSNTRHLYEIARRHAPTYYVRDANAISADGITHFLPDEERETRRPFLWPEAKDVGVLAGASCPPDVIDGLVEKMATL